MVTDDLTDELKLYSKLRLIICPIPESGDVGSTVVGFIVSVYSSEMIQRRPTCKTHGTGQNESLTDSASAMLKTWTNES